VEAESERGAGAVAIEEVLDVAGGGEEESGLLAGPGWVYGDANQ
jgi:hypothetical protein